MQRTHVVFPALASLIGVGVLAGCPGRDVSRVDPRQAREQVKDIPINLSRDIDILFVIDNSISMGQEQASLQANFPAFIDVLEGIEGGLPNTHIAVVSSDVGIGSSNARGGCMGDGDDGKFRLGYTPTSMTAGNKDTCNVIDGNESFLIGGSASSGATPNYNTATLADAFSCIAGLGDDGCGFEHHLESMRRALTKAQDGSAPNAGFLRDDAYLAVIIIADEDDCSATADGANGVFTVDMAQDRADSEVGFFTSFRCWEFGVVCNDDVPAPRDMPGDGTPSARTNCVPRDDSAYMEKVSTYVDFLKSLKTDPKRVIVAGIIGDPEPVNVALVNGDGDPGLEHVLQPSCMSSSGQAAPSTRISAFLEGFPDRNSRSTICDPDLTQGLVQIAELLARVVGTPCLEGELADIDPDTAGVQPDCRVSDFQNKGTDAEVETSMPSCDQSGGAKPCYNLVDGGDQCSAEPTGLALEILRDGDTPPETTVGIRCLAAT